MPAKPGVSLEKSGRYVDLGIKGGDTADRIEWTFTVTNTGDTTLTDVRIDDPMVPDARCADTSLAPGESTTCTGSSRVTAAMVLKGEIRNQATVSASTIGECTDGSDGTLGCTMTALAADTAIVYIADPPKEPGLPQTGGSATPDLVLLGLAMIGLGVMAVRRGRRDEN